MAHYLVAMADRLDIATVAFDGRVWTAGDGEKWRSEDGSGPARRLRVEVLA
jgi:hypothetical protein